MDREHFLTASPKIGIKKIIPLAVIINLFFIGFNLGIFFDSVYLRELLCSPLIYSCLSETSVEQDRINALLTYNFLRGYSSIIFIISLIIGGAISDNIRTKYGNRVPIILVGAVLSGIGYIFLPFFIVPTYPEFIPSEPISFLPQAPYVSGAIVYTLISMGFGLMVSSGTSFISELFTPEQRGLVGLITVSVGILGTVIGLVLNVQLVDNLIVTDRSFEINWILICGLIGGFIIILGSLTFFFSPKINPNHPKSGILKDIKNTPYYIFKLGNNHKSDRDVKYSLLITMLWGGAGFIIVANIPNFIDDLRSSRLTDLYPGSFLLLMGLFAGVSSIFVFILIKKFGKSKTGIIGSAIFALFCFLISRPSLWNSSSLIFLALLAGMGSIIVSSVSLSMPADLVPKGKEAQFMGIFIASSNVLIPLMSLIAGYIFSIQNSILDGYSNLFLISSFFYLGAILFLLFINYEERIKTSFSHFFNRFLYYKGYIKQKQTN